MAAVNRALDHVVAMMRKGQGHETKPIDLHWVCTTCEWTSIDDLDAILSDFEKETWEN